MKATDLRDAINLLRSRGYELPCEIVLAAKDFTAFQMDMCTTRTLTSDKTPDRLERNQVRFMGVTVTGKLCTCGAHPEDWKGL